MIKNQKIFKAVCKENYVETRLDGSKPNSNENLYYIDILIYKEGDEVYYKKEDDIYYTSLKHDYLYKLNYYNTDINQMDEENFNKHLKII